MEDTEWTDILKKHGIIKEEPKKEEKEEEPEVSDFDRKLNGITSEDDLLDLDDDSDEDVIREYRSRRMAEMKANSLIPRFGDVREITASDYVEQVNNAGPGIWVVLLLYQTGVPECSVLSEIINELAIKHSKTKFLKSIASLCVANFPETSLPAIFIYNNGNLKKQLIGLKKNLNIKSVEQLLSQTGALIIDSESDSKSGNKSNKFYQHFD